MVIHIAIYRFKKGTSEKDIQALLEDVKALKSELEGIKDIYSGKNFSKWNKGFTHAIVIIAKDKAALNAYRKHPLHKPIAENADKMEDDGIGIDFES